MLERTGLRGKDNREDQKRIIEEKFKCKWNPRSSQATGNSLLASAPCLRTVQQGWARCPLPRPCTWDLWLWAQEVSVPVLGRSYQPLCAAGEHGDPVELVTSVVRRASASEVQARKQSRSEPMFSVVRGSEQQLRWDLRLPENTLMTILCITPWIPRAFIHTIST